MRATSKARCAAAASMTSRSCSTSAANRDAVIARDRIRLLQRTARGDLVMLSIAGHGAQEPERVKGSQPDGMDTVFLLPGFRHDSGRIDASASSGRNSTTSSSSFEERGARVLFVADTCHGGGMTRDVDPRGERNELPPGSALSHSERRSCADLDGADAFLTELDFEKTRVSRRSRPQHQGAGGAHSRSSPATAARSAMRSRARWKARPTRTTTARSR